MIDLIYCPKCGESDYVRERSPRGKTKCNNCNFVDLSLIWDGLNNGERLKIEREKLKIANEQNKIMKDALEVAEGHGKSFEQLSFRYMDAGKDSVDIAKLSEVRFMINEIRQALKKLNGDNND